MFEITINHGCAVTYSLDFQESIFPSGEEKVRLTHERRTGESGEYKKKVKVVARLTGSSDVMRLFLLKDAIDRKHPGYACELVLPYLPYARQDRVCNIGESHSLAVFARLVNSMRFDKVTIVDPHSIVAEALIERVEVWHQWSVLAGIGHRFGYKDHIVSPDAGAAKKTGDAAIVMSHDSFIRCDKRRELSTGRIVETIVHADAVGGDCLIVDDICEHGGTFKAIAEILRKKGASKVGLFVTHGCFGGPLQRESVIRGLLASGIDYIHTTDTYDRYVLPSDIKNFYVHQLTF